MKKSYFLFVILFFVVFIFIGNVVYANTNDNNTRIWIDYPKNNEEIGKQLKIQGWVMSKFANTEVEVYLDQTKIDVQRLQRPDVINSVSEYGTLNENPTPGFYKITDISNLSYGLHKLTINVLKDNQKVLRKGERTCQYHILSGRLMRRSRWRPRASTTKRNLNCCCGIISRY